MSIVTGNQNEVNFLGLTSSVRENILRALVGNLKTVTWGDTVKKNTQRNTYDWKTWNDMVDSSMVNVMTVHSGLVGYTVFKDSDDVDMLATNSGIWVKIYPNRGEYSDTDGATGVIDYDFCVYLALSATCPDKAGGNVTEPWDTVESTGEVDDPNYARFPLAYNGISQYLTICNDDTDPAGNDGRNVACVAAVNATMRQEIKFNRSTKAWTNTYPYFALYTHPTEGEIIAWGKLTNPIEVTQADVVPLFEEGKFRLFFPAPEEVEAYVDTEYNDTTI